MTLQSAVRLFFVSLLFAPAAASAQESFCPGGSSPRSDVLMCFDFDKVSRCATGREPECWTDNGIANGERINGHGFRITSGDSAAGAGYIHGAGDPGSTGPGYTEWGLPGNGHNAITMRYYVKMDKSYMMYGIGSHGPGIRGSGTGCSMGGTFEQPAFGYSYYNAGGCGAGSFDLNPNQPNPPILRNDRWYLIEQQRVVDTQCADITKTDGCNGIARLWIDGQLVMEYTNLNWGGVKNGLKWNAINGPRHYYHVRVPAWQPEMSYDNLVVTNTQARIGGAVGEKPRSAGDPQSPYYNYIGIEPFVGHHPDNDCSESGAPLSSNISVKFRGDVAYESTIVNNKVADKCPGTSQNRAMKAVIPGNSGGAGMQWERAGGGRMPVTFPAQIITGWINLPASNDYSNLPALAGFRGYSCGLDGCDSSQWGNYLAMSVKDGKWAVTQRANKTSKAPVVVEVTSEPVRFGQWTEFEIIIWKDAKVTLSIDRKRLLEKRSLPMGVEWMYEAALDSGIVAGVIDFTGKGPFTAYYDDLSVSTASTWTCDGWSASACPFSGGTGGSPAPSPAPTAPGMPGGVKVEQIP